MGSYITSPIQADNGRPGPQWAASWSAWLDAETSCPMCQTEHLLSEGGRRQTVEKPVDWRIYYHSQFG